MGFLYFVGFWSMTFGKVASNVILFIFLFALVKSFFFLNINGLRINGWKNWASISINLVIIAVFFGPFLQAIKGRKYTKDSINLDVPFRSGNFIVIHGGSHQAINHHYPIKAQRYALDIVSLNKWGRRSHKFFPSSLEDYNSYNVQLFSPCDGIVLECENACDDLEIGETDIDQPAGNYIAIKNTKLNVVVILAHLKKGSLKVKEGDVIEKGQYIGKIGNSGNTSEPHLHIHAKINDEKGQILAGEGIPITFNQKFFVRNDLIRCPK